MVRSKRLEPIKKLANNQEQQSARDLGAAIELQKVEEQKLNQLLQYQKEYLNGMEEKVRAGVTGATLQSYHQFLNKIEIAISQQKEVLIKCEAQIAANQNKWQSDHGRNKAIGQVMEKIKTKEEKVKQKKESSYADEISTQSFIRRQNSNTKY